MSSHTITTDFLIIGSGAAGLQAAWKASQFGSVTLLTKSTLEDSSSSWAQGGIAAVLTEGDSYKNHINDTLEAGRGLCNQEAVKVLVEEGAQSVQELIDEGMPFDRTAGTLDLGLEGGHSNRRVLHANGAATGKALVNFLADKVHAQPNISIIEHAFVFELLATDKQCMGAAAYLYNEAEIIAVQSPVTVLATGGYSGLYQRSTNPHTSTGDGLWLGYNAGTELQDLEFVQFHPTAFYTDDGSTFLISEAVRGEGAHLYNEGGERFMVDYPQKELSPRDVVAKEIFEQIKRSDSGCVYLDISHLDTDRIRDHFPALIKRIENQGFNIATDQIPVAPAAHYCIGGIATDLHARTSIEGLYACGEVAATGVHGANRLASNSLLECLVFARRAVHDAAKRDFHESGCDLPSVALKVNNDNKEQFTHLQNRVSTLLSEEVGIVRNARGMNKALDRIKEIMTAYNENANEYFELRSKGLLQIATLITKSALERTESRGVHTRADYPQTNSVSGHLSFSKKSLDILSKEV